MEQRIEKGGIKGGRGTDGGRCELDLYSCCTLESTGPFEEMRQTKKRGKSYRQRQRKKEYLESKWHQFASQLSNDGFCMTRHNLG